MALAPWFALVGPAGAVDSVCVIDGNGCENIRLLGIDAIELRQTCRRGGAVYTRGKVSAAILRGLVDNSPVTCSRVDQNTCEQSIERPAAMT